MLLTVIYKLWIRKTGYIKHRQSIVPEVVEEDNDLQYNQSVALNAKARERAKQRTNVEEKKDKEENSKMLNR